MSLPSRLLVGVLLATFAAHYPADAQQTRREQHRIVREEIDASSASNAFELIRGIRPVWLRTRGIRSLRADTIRRGEQFTAVPRQGEIWVYVDGIRLGNQETLRQVSTDEIEGLQFLDPPQATTRFGTGHTHGAILITRRR
jgi:hypothetical protein